MKIEDIPQITSELFQVYWALSNLHYKERNSATITEARLLLKRFLEKHKSLLGWHVTDEMWNRFIETLDILDTILEEESQDVMEPKYSKEKYAGWFYALRDDIFETIPALQQTSVHTRFYTHSQKVYSYYAFAAELDPIGFCSYESSREAGQFYVSPLSLMKLTMDAYLTRIAFFVGIEGFIPFTIRYRIIVQPGKESEYEYRLVNSCHLGGSWKKSLIEVFNVISINRIENVLVIDNIFPEESGIKSPFPENRFDTRDEEQVKRFEQMMRRM